MNTQQNGIYGYWDKEKSQIVYIGQSQNIDRRHREHINPSKYNEQVINRVLQNNPGRYELAIIKTRSTFSKEDRDILEKHYIELYETFIDKNKFNYTTGGDSNPMYGKHHSEETKRKMSEAHRGEKNHMYGKHHSEETIEKMRKSQIGSNNHFYGKHHSQEAIEKMRKAKLGKYNGSNNPMYGKHHSQEAIEKIRKANLGQKSPMYGKLGSKHPKYGRHLSEESKIKMSLSKGNKTGYFRVSLKSCSSCKSGKIYEYQYYNDDKKKLYISSVNLEKLKQKVLKAGLPWRKLK